MKKILLTTVLSLMMCMGVFAQAQPDYLNPPKPNEKVIGTVSITGEEAFGSSSSIGNKLKWYEKLLNKAKQEFPNKVVDIRSMEVGSEYSWKGEHSNKWYGPAVGKVVYTINLESQTYENLSQALNKALRNVREGSRFAIDQVTVISGMDRETLKDQLLDLLLDKGYKVIAKEYLDKLYEEQQNQQSGIYNDNTTVQDNNFSAVGYYINVKVTETSLRVQVVNVSTGEYEGNATVNF